MSQRQVFENKEKSKEDTINEYLSKEGYSIDICNEGFLYVEHDGKRYWIQETYNIIFGDDIDWAKGWFFKIFLSGYADQTGFIGPFATKKELLDFVMYKFVNSSYSLDELVSMDWQSQNDSLADIDD